MLRINSYQDSASFKANLKSPQLRLSQKDFFIKIRGYGRNTEWAREVKATTDVAVEMIREKQDCDNILQFISARIKDANKIPLSIEKRMHSGILRTIRPGYECDTKWAGNGLITEYTGINRYSGYADRLNKRLEKPLTNPFPGMELTVPEAESLKTRYLYHAPFYSINNALDIVKYQYNALHKRFKPEKVDSKNIDEINNRIAKIRWILAHATPWQRGSDAISNVFMRALYKAFGVKAGESAQNISFDLEAYCTNLQEYQKRFPSYFKTPPKVIE